MICCVINTNNLEIERKFLVTDESYKELAVSHALIRQGYLHVHPTVRIRQYGDKFILTIKGSPATGHIGRLEWEKEISQQDFEILFPLCQSGIVEKTRWLVPLANGLVCEVDEFHAADAGLVMAEVELPSEDTVFDRPNFLGEEVTADGRYYNSYLSAHPYSTWK